MKKFKLLLSCIAVGFWASAVSGTAFGVKPSSSGIHKAYSDANMITIPLSVGLPSNPYAKDGHAGEHLGFRVYKISDFAIDGFKFTSFLNDSSIPIYSKQLNTGKIFFSKEAKDFKPVNLGDPKFSLDTTAGSYAYDSTDRSIPTKFTMKLTQGSTQAPVTNSFALVKDGSVDLAKEPYKFKLAAAMQGIEINSGVTKTGKVGFKYKPALLGVVLPRYSYLAYAHTLKTNLIGDDKGDNKDYIAFRRVGAKSGEPFIRMRLARGCIYFGPKLPTKTLEDQNQCIFAPESFGGDPDIIKKELHKTLNGQIGPDAKKTKDRVNSKESKYAAYRTMVLGLALKDKIVCAKGNYKGTDCDSFLKPGVYTGSFEMTFMPLNNHIPGKSNPPTDSIDAALN